MSAFYEQGMPAVDFSAPLEVFPGDLPGEIQKSMQGIIQDHPDLEPVDAFRLALSDFVASVATKDQRPEKILA